MYRVTSPIVKHRWTKKGHLNPVRIDNKAIRTKRKEKVRWLPCCCSEQNSGHNLEIKVHTYINPLSPAVSSISSASELHERTTLKCKMSMGPLINGSTSESSPVVVFSLGAGGLSTEERVYTVFICWSSFRGTFFKTHLRWSLPCCRSRACRFQRSSGRNWPMINKRQILAMTY